MIRNDQFTQAVIFLLVLMGLIGLIRPDWFIRISGFPRVTLRDHRPGLPPGAHRRARFWALVSLLGALLLYWMATS